VELESLSIADFERILTSTDACLTKQYQALLATEDVQLEFAPDGINRLAEIAYSVNERTENIGARRLYTVMEKLLEELSFTASEDSGKTITIDAAYVNAAWMRWRSTKTCRATCCKEYRMANKARNAAKMTMRVEPSQKPPRNPVALAARQRRRRAACQAARGRAPCRQAAAGAHRSAAAPGRAVIPSAGARDGARSPG
jgi:hypothetical protein